MAILVDPPADELGHWLDGVASRLALNEIRRRRRRPWTRPSDHEGAAAEIRIEAMIEDEAAAA